MPLIYNTLTSHRLILRWLTVEAIRQRIYPDNKNGADKIYYEMCSQQLDETIKKFIIKMVIIFSSASVGTSWYIFQNIHNGSKTTLTQIKFPFIFESSNAEFIANLLLQFVITVHGFLGYIGLEIGTTVKTDFITVSRKLLGYKLKSMDLQYEDGTLIDSQLFFELRKIIHVIRGYDKYIS